MFTRNVANAPRVTQFLKNIAHAPTHTPKTIAKRQISNTAQAIMTDPYIMMTYTPVALYTAAKAMEWTQQYTTPNPTIQAITKTNTNRTDFDDKNIKHAIQTLFSSPETLVGFNQIIEGLSDKKQAQNPACWTGKKACGNMSILVSVVLKHLGLSPKIVGIMDETLDLYDIQTSGWHSGKAPQHVWVAIDTIGNKKLEKPLWIDLTCRQFTGLPTSKTSLDVPHGLIGFKDEFLNATGPYREQWENEKNVTDFFERYVTQLETELYHDIQAHDRSFLEFPFMATQQVHDGLYTLLNTLNDRK